MLPQVWMDIAVVVGMFVLRVAVPITLTIVLGKWLEKKLAPPAEKPALIRSASKIIQLHCWDLKRCEPSIRAQCAAYKHPDLPCWLAIQAEGGRVRAECFECAMYKPQTKAA